ncbi:MAG: Crp/Fnr family transcriptional regulator [Bacteroidetes bacterium]|nr:Crp/Fnr family transcriptional regulator [Bacteroidota bacterium]
MKFINPSCVSCSAKNCFINKYCTDEWKKTLSEKKMSNRYSKGQVIFLEGDSVPGIYFIYKGKVKIYNTGPKGRTQIVRFADKGDIFGHRGFGQHLVYPISAAAIEDTVSCFIPYKEFLEALNNNPPLVLNLMLFYADELKRAEYKLRSLSQMTVKQKLAEAILTIRSIYGAEKKENLKFLKVNLSRQEYADIVGSSLEEIIRTFSLLQKEGGIVTTRNSVAIVDESILKSYLKDFKNVLLP